MRTVAATQSASRLLQQPNELCKMDLSGPRQPWYFPRWVLVKQLSGWHAVKEASKHSFVECRLPGSSAPRNSHWGNPPSKLTHKSLLTLYFNIWGRFFRTWCYLKISWASLVVQKEKNLPAMQETWVKYLGQEDPLEKGVVTYCSILAWGIPKFVLLVAVILCP